MNHVVRRAFLSLLALAAGMSAAQPVPMDAAAIAGVVRRSAGTGAGEGGEAETRGVASR